MTLPLAIAAAAESADFIPPLWRILTKSFYFGGVGLGLGAAIVHLVAVRPAILPGSATDHDRDIMRRRSALTMGWAGLVLFLVLYPQLAGKVARAGKGMPFHEALAPSAVWDYLTLQPKSGEWLSVGNMAFIQFGLLAVFALLLILLFLKRAEKNINTIALVSGWGIAAASLVLVVPRNVKGETPIESFVHLLTLLHPLSGGVWLGGIFSLTLLAFSRQRLSVDGGLIWSQIWKRFSVVAQVCVGLLLVSGLLLAWQAIGAVPQLWETPYGRVLLLKVSLVGSLIVIGFYNEYFLIPKAVKLRAVGDHRGLFSLVLHHFPKAVAVEAVLGLGVLAVVPFLNGSGREQVGGEADPEPTSGILTAVVLLLVFGIFSFIANARFHRLRERRIEREYQETRKDLSGASVS